MKYLKLAGWWFLSLFTLVFTPILLILIPFKAVQFWLEDDNNYFTYTEHVLLGLQSLVEAIVLPVQYGLEGFKSN